MPIFGKTRTIFCAAVCFAAALFAQGAQSADSKEPPRRDDTESRQKNGGTGKGQSVSGVPQKNLQNVYMVSSSLSKAAEDALNSGMPALAESMAARVYESPSASEQSRETARQVLVNACISQGKFEQAGKYLYNSAKLNPEDKVREALILTGLGKYEEAEKLVVEAEDEGLKKDFQSWLYMAKGYIAYARGNYATAVENFESAKKLSPNGYISADAEVAINTCKIARDNSDSDSEKLEQELAKKVSLYMGTPAGFQAAKQYAGLLFKMGKLGEALDVIDAQLGIELADSVDKDELRLIGASINPDVNGRVSVLKDVMKSSSSTGVMDFALAMYIRDTKDTPKEQLEFLKDLSENGSPTVRDRILLEISKNCLRLKDYPNARIAAKRILDDYPASVYKTHALRILSWIAFNGESEASAPQYRLAANYLESLAELEKDQKKSAKIKLLAADCYFLNQDYAGAERIYALLLGAELENINSLVEHYIDALLLQNKYNEAVNLLSKLQTDGKISENALWNSAWKILTQYRRNSGDVKTLESIEKLLEQNSDMSASLRAKMLWLRARITDETGKTKSVVDLCKKLLDELSKLENKDSPDITQIRSNTLLMLGRALSKDGAFEGNGGAFAVYDTLRKDFPKSDAAQVSYLYQAADLAAMERFNEARELCVELADKYPSGKYEYSALFDAAEYSRRMGMDSNYRTAISLLERLTQKYPDNPRNYYVKLMQAEILRLMGAFADARNLYNDLLNTNASHPEIYLAWMGLGDSTSALPGRSRDAAAIFERLYALPSVGAEAKAEAAYKWAFALESSGKRPEANEVRWVTSLDLLKDKNLHAAARYWVGRSLFDMARSLEQSGQSRDARAAYETIVKHNLPSAKIARAKLGTQRKE